MTTGEYLLNLGLLAYILAANLGTRPLSRRRIALPLLIVAGVGYTFLRNVPTSGNDVQLELAGLTLGVLFGVVAGLLVRVSRTENGRLVTTAGAAFAAIWVFVIGGRTLFAYGADHWFGRDIAQFSVQNQITGSGAWTAAFVLMALAMVISRVLVTAGQAARLDVRTATFAN